MKAVSVAPVPGGKEVVCGAFGNRCTICGSYFDEGGICNNGHEEGGKYYLPPETEEPKTASSASVVTEVKTEMETCQVFDSCKCTICGGFFADGGDTICANGHEIGQQYPRKVA